jgi:ubiquitin-like 1-activating enzyme E1 A
MVDVVAKPTSVDSEPDEFFQRFDIICANGCTIQQNTRLNQICRLNNIKFFAADVFGFSGYMFADLLLHDFSM